MQNVGTPRFYVDYLQWWKAMGLNYDDTTSLNNSDYFWNFDNTQIYDDLAIGTANDNLVKGTVGLNPSFDVRYSGILDTNQTGWNHVNRLHSSFPVHQMNCIGYLGHNIASAPGNMGFSYRYHAYSTDDDGVVGSTYPYANVTTDLQINCTISGETATPIYDGFSFSSCNGTTSPNLDLASWGGCITRGTTGAGLTTFEHRMGSQFWGRTYEMPHSPDLSLTMSVEMDGVKNIKTRGGASLTGINYTKPPDWGDSGAWQLGGVSNLRNGRRSWDLSFSYLSDSDIMPKVAASTNYGAEDYYTTDANYQDDTLLDGTDFFSEVWNKTMGGHLPFIFQPDGGDNSTNSPDGFAICRFDMNSLQYDQVANNVYNVKLKIRECW